MLGIEQFKKIQEYKALGISKLKVSEILNLSYKTVDNWWDRDEEYVYKFERDHEFILDNYRQYILEIIKTYPGINNTVILRKLKDDFKDFNLPNSTVFRYIKNLRSQTGYEKPKRRFIMQDVTEPAYQGQVDFGQYVMKTMYGNNIRVYFFVMMLSFSRMKFVYFSVESFTAKKVIEAHNYAFKYFGGRPQSVVYDQDKTMVVSENIGSIIFVKEFEKYIKDTGYSIYLCKGYDPQTKGKVENAVKFIKENFLVDRTYYGIDRLNAEYLAWLDRDGNGLISYVTKKVPRELFKKEANLLIKVYKKKNNDIKVLSLDKGAFEYEDNFYKVPLIGTKDGDIVRIEKIDDFILVYHVLTNDLICKHKLATGKGNVIPVKYEEDNMPNVEDELLSIYKGNNDVTHFLKRMREQKPRYVYGQCIRFISMRKYYTEDQILEAVKYCNAKDKCTMMELSSYLLYKHGEAIARKYIHNHVFKKYKETAQEIREALDGRS